MHQTNLYWLNFQIYTCILKLCAFLFLPHFAFLSYSRLVYVALALNLIKLKNGLRLLQYFLCTALFLMQTFQYFNINCLLVCWIIQVPDTPQTDEFLLWALGWVVTSESEPSIISSRERSCLSEVVFTIPLYSYIGLHLVTMTFFEVISRPFSPEIFCSRSCRPLVTSKFPTLHGLSTLVPQIRYFRLGNSRLCRFSELKADCQKPS